MKTDDTLSAEFGIEPMQITEVITKEGEIVKTSDSKIEDDYEITRNNLRLILQQGQSALMKALDVAHQSEHPRAFEVVGNLMKQLADVNQQLLDLHQQKQKLDAPTKEASRKEVTNNNVIFTGSTAELNKLIKNMAKGE
jgi:endoglucanase Acf2